MAAKSAGNCYVCGAELGKAAMKNHLLKEHGDCEGGQECRLLKIESADADGYWLFVDVPAEKTLESVDDFLRKIWLECCGHMSQFCVEPWQDEIGLDRKLETFADGDKFYHLYDFGDTTETLVTVVGATARKKQKGVARLLARNVPPAFACSECGKPAVSACDDEGDGDLSFFCAGCAAARRDGGEDDEDDFMFPVSNSPRMGQCAYRGELDKFAFDPASAKAAV